MSTKSFWLFTVLVLWTWVYKYSFYKNSVLNLSQNYWKTNASLQSFISSVSISSLNCCMRHASMVSSSVSTISCSSISLIYSSISFIDNDNTITGNNASFVNGVSRMWASSISIAILRQLIVAHLLRTFAWIIAL